MDKVAVQNYISLAILMRRIEMSETGKGHSKAVKRENFVRIAEKRTKNAIKAIRIIGKLANRNAYEYGETDVKKIVSALNKEIETMRARFSQTGAREAVEFNL
jgi:hypothetical protein